MIFEFAKSVPDESLPPKDTPLWRLVAESGNEVWVAVGAPATRAQPSDPSLLTHARPGPVHLLLREGESPDEQGGRCPALQQKCQAVSRDEEWHARVVFMPAIVAMVWFSDLPLVRLEEEVRAGYSHQWDGYSGECERPTDRMPEASVVAAVRETACVRDVLRPLVDFRRRDALGARFAESPLRLLPLHVAMQVLEFLVTPAASRPWIKAWYGRAGEPGCEAER